MAWPDVEVESQLPRNVESPKNLCMFTLSVYYECSVVYSFTSSFYFVNNTFQLPVTYLQSYGHVSACTTSWRVLWPLFFFTKYTQLDIYSEEKLFTAMKALIFCIYNILVLLLCCRYDLRFLTATEQTK